MEFSRKLIFLQGILLHSFSVFGRDGFLKDQNENLVEFPPKVIQSFDDFIPTGHLRPLGWQRIPSGSVDELDSMPDSEEFFGKFVVAHKPVVFRKVFKDIPAMKSWGKKNYLKEKYGKIDIDVVVKKEYFRVGPRRMKFEKFLRDYQYEDLYLTNFVPQEMMAELVLPTCLRCGFVEWLMESELWMSSGGTSSLLHSHADHDIHCLVTGRKDFVFIENKYRKFFDYHDGHPFEGSGHSALDMDQINMFKYGDIADVPWTWSILRSGDCVFVPAGYLHQVRSYGKSISYTNHFAPTPDMDFKNCAEPADKDMILLSEIHFLWTYREGRLLLANSKLAGDDVIHHLLMLMRNQTQLTRELFSAFYEELMTEAKNFPSADEIWSEISRGEEFLSRETLKNLPENFLQRVADALNIPHAELVAKQRDEL